MLHKLTYLLASVSGVAASGSASIGTSNVDLNLAGSGTGVINMVANGESQFKIYDGKIVPTTSGNINFGENDLRFNDIYLTGMIKMSGDLNFATDNKKIILGSPNQVQLLHLPDTGIKMTEAGGTVELQFQDAGEFIRGDGTDLTIGSSAQLNIRCRCRYTTVDGGSRCY